MTKLGLNLKNLLNQTKLTESELARRTGVAQQVINRIASGKNTTFAQQKRRFNWFSNRTKTSWHKCKRWLTLVLRKLQPQTL